MFPIFWETTDFRHTFFISAISHNEDAWKDCQASHALIPYSKAFNLKAF